ncbi:MAG TPA: TetR/AcrR family transcriptional regulator [Myxococcota bacterium]|nr:TetR/AcrR family transcriptional regulator [Myxococcota bacterium]
MEPQLQPAALRRNRQREEARRAILDATEAILLEDGEELLSIRKLALRCGYTAPTIYHYFRDKDGLIDALLEERFSRLLQRIRRVALVADPVANIREYSRAFFRFASANPTFYRVMIRGSSDGGERKIQAAEAAREIMSDQLRALAAAGRLWTTDVDAALQSLWAVLHGVVALRLGNPKYGWSKNFSEVALETVLRGLVRPALARNGKGPS